ncbi:MAG TPA: LysR family transcriptional regulator [Dokdonella sp.]|uniref:winged helix-turn-helix domain-containing protein n=1 Tax=Dokdonella sp. TaxID=2291710 RepID=UPI002C7A0267|nr:LysR family transcriptional regulator [Dokdonella sp.]HUD43486.1 LysR family transcriptional regulator [Dokdonella sp.]
MPPSERRSTRTTVCAAAAESRPRLSLRVLRGRAGVLGPGKADLLEGIDQTGSIAAAGRRLKMSYKRAWQLAEELNRGFRDPLIEASKGGSGGGGAQLTVLGREVLRRYRRIEAACSQAAAADLAALQRRMARD